MTDKDLLKCPLIGGLDELHRAELLRLLNRNRNLRDKLKVCLEISECSAESRETAAQETVASPPPAAGKKVHTWSPASPMGRRSLKE